MNRKMILLLVASCLVTAQAQAQVVREGGVGSVAGVLGAGEDYNDFDFKSDGGQILFADLDAEMYVIPGGDHGGCEEAATTTTTLEADGGSSGGCGCEDGGGAGGFRLEVFEVFLDGAPELLCAAGKPKRPGWDRDPRLACVIENEGDYVLRVMFSGHTEHTELAAEAPAEPAVRPYLLNVSLRGIAGDGSDLLEAFEQSANQFPFRD